MQLALHIFLDIMQFYYRFISIQLLIGLVTTKFANLVLEHCKLFEEVMHRLFTILVHRRLAVERHELLYTTLAGTQCKVAEEDEVEHQWSRQN